MSDELVVKKPRKKKPDGITKIVRIELTGSDGDSDEVKKRLLKMAIQMQQITNDYVNHWLHLHQRAGNHIAVREWIKKDSEWARAYKGKKDAPDRVKCPVFPCTPAMSKELYKLLMEDHVSLGTKPIGIITQNTLKTLISMPSTKSAYKRWMTILSGYGEFPQSQKPAPIPFYTANSRIIRPATDKDPWKLEVRFEKQAGTRMLRPIVLRMRTGGHKLAAIREALHNIASGKWIFNTSSLVYRDGTWYAHICYKITDIEMPVLDANKTAFLSAGRYLLRGACPCPVHPPGFRTLCCNCKEPSSGTVEGHPVLFRINGRTLMNLCDGNQIQRARKLLNEQRFSKNESYKYASSARKAHGRKSLQWRDKNRMTWRNNVKTTNSRLVADVVKRCIATKTGRLVTYQPVGNWRDSRFLTNIGKTSRRESTGWDWYQLQLLLKQACQAVGIEITQKQIGESRQKKGKGKKAA
jgi:hypothetical protein